MQPIYTQRNQKCQYRRAYLNGGGVVVQLEGQARRSIKTCKKYADARQQHPADAVGDSLAFFPRWCCSCVASFVPGAARLC